MAKIYGTDYMDIIAGWFDGVTDDTDTIFGFGGSDQIFAAGGDDILVGGDGHDYLNGGDGSDTASYGDSPVGVFVDLSTGQGHYGTAEGDMLVSIENVTGSLFDDSLLGDSGTNVLSGGFGNDYLNGGGGGDILNGGFGFDTAGYSGSPTGVVVSLLWHTASGGDADGDQLNSIENLTGSTHDDGLFGDNGANTLTGGNGDDTLLGFGGNDTLYGDGRNASGNDSLNGGAGEDQLWGGLGVDTLAGGPDADTFGWASVQETGAYDAATIDTILDFNPAQGDKIDLHYIDANKSIAGDQAFTFVGTADFSVPGQIRYFNIGNETFIVLNTDGNPDNDAAIHLSGVLTPDASWFVL
jgi:Ca2+-binding RTX toxin-like protein